MKYNYIGIDPSITSTGLVVNGKLFSYSYETAGYTKKGNLTKWYELSEHVVNFKFHNKAIFNSYKEEQIVKLDLYRSVISSIMVDIYENIDINKKTLIALEGYSYGSQSGNLIDLVTFGTLLRDRLFEITEDIIVLSPMTLKLESCKMTYPPIIKEIGKRKKKTVKEYKNNDGISGGKFTKIEIYKSLTENINLNDDYINHLRKIEKDVMCGKNIPKPYDDINDGLCLFLYIKHQHTHHYIE